MNSILTKLKGGLIVSCQALEYEPLFGSGIMGKMASAAKEGGAAGIRANTGADIADIKKEVDLPVIGLVKRNYSDSEIYITPTMKEIREVAEAGAEIIAFDATNRVRPNGQSLKEFVDDIKREYPDHLLMADISTFEEGMAAVELGLNMISTTLCGYTPYTKNFLSFNKDLLVSLVRESGVPVIAEGRVDTPGLAADCLELGAYAVVVGSAITRPQEITRRFVKEIMKDI